MNEEVIEEVITKSVVATPYSNSPDTTEAFIKGARMMHEFLLFNPNLLKSAEAEEFIQYRIFPSVINQ